MPAAERPLPFPALASIGLNLQAVLDLAQLPADVSQGLALSEDERACFTQLLLIGHGGRRMWEVVQQRGMQGAHPIDEFSREQATQLFAPGGPLQGHRFRVVFPGTHPIGLQRLGELAGWHHRAPFFVGVNRTWGSWFAYRTVVVADTRLPITARQSGDSPCVSCEDQPCLNACPADALRGEYKMSACIEHRKQLNSSCEDRCLARNACPVGAQHRYSDAQTSYHYLQSMPAIRTFY